MTSLNARAAAIVAAGLALPVVGLVVLVAEPRLDVAWEHHPAHFWLVLATGACTATLAYATGTAAKRRSDARVFLVSLTFVSSAGFLGLHALATPGVLLDGPNAGFNLATPFGLLVAAVFAAASSAELTAERARKVMSRARLLRAAVLVLIAGWGVASLSGVPPLDSSVSVEQGSALLVALGLSGLALYAFAVLRYLRLARSGRWAALPIAMACGFTLLVEAEIAITAGRNWHAMWWEWHVLMLASFAVVAISAHRQWHEERFVGLYTEDTVAGSREISVLFADLQGFTPLSERLSSHEVATMLNEYFSVAIPPVVEKAGGRVDRLIGDALMVTFNVYGDQPDHAERAARAALAIQEVTAEIARKHDEWPRFRVGVNTGEATVGVLGTSGGRTYTVVGDTVNLAARLEAAAPSGGVVIGAETARQLPDAVTKPLGPIEVKGKVDAVDAYQLLALSR